MGADELFDAVIVGALLRRLEAQGKLELFFNLLSHRARPSQVLTPPRLLAATGRVLARRGCDRRAVLRELRTLTIQQTRRRRLNRHPVYTDDDAMRERELSVR